MEDTESKGVPPMTATELMEKQEEHERYWEKRIPDELDQIYDEMVEGISEELLELLYKRLKIEGKVVIIGTPK